MEDGQDAKSVNAINYPEDENLDHHDESFDIAGLHLKGRESKPRTAAQPQLWEDTGFQ